MGFWIFMCATVLLIPFLMISFGGLFSRSAPKEINSAFGYRTSMSMKNADTWQFAHHYFGKIWRTLGWILIIPSVIPMLFVIGKGNDPVGNMGLIITFLQLIPLILPIFFTEKALRAHFDRNGNRIF